MPRLTHVITSNASVQRVRGTIGKDEHTLRAVRQEGMREAMERVWLTRNEGGEASQGDHCPEVIPPEHALLETKRDPSDSDQARDKEEGQRGVCARWSVRAGNDGDGTPTFEISQGGSHRG